MEHDREQKDYERAALVLNSMQWESTFGHLTKKTKKIEMFRNCMDRLGLQVDKLSIIHVADTKGKVSTCAYVESILRKHRYKTGLFSSPHVVEIRERILINGSPVAKDLFTSTFWQVFERLQLTRASSRDVMPGYSMFTLLMAMHVFVRSDLDVVILEVGIGGEYDATNFVPKPAVCGVASLHLEHTDVLGNTIQEIAWHKAGIMKSGVPMVIVPHQDDSVMAVFLKRAKEKRCPLYVVTPLKEELHDVTLGLLGSRQNINVALALQLSRLWLKHKVQGDAEDMVNVDEVTSVIDIPQLKNTNLDHKEKEGLAKVELPGRDMVIKEDGVTYYLDGGHDTDSMKQCVQWFKEKATQVEERLGVPVSRALVFGTKTKKGADDHLRHLVDFGFDRVAFCPHVVSVSEREKFVDAMDIRKDPKDAKLIAKFHLKNWEELMGKKTSSTPCQLRCCPSIVSALWWAGGERETSPHKDLAQKDDLHAEEARKKGSEASSIPPQASAAGHKGRAVDESSAGSHPQVLVTGSLVMVGGALCLIKPDV